MMVFKALSAVKGIAEQSKVSSKTKINAKVTSSRETQLGLVKRKHTKRIPDSQWYLRDCRLRWSLSKIKDLMESEIISKEMWIGTSCIGWMKIIINIIAFQTNSIPNRCKWQCRTLDSGHKGRTRCHWRSVKTTPISRGEPNDSPYETKMLCFTSPIDHHGKWLISSRSQINKAETLFVLID